MAIRSSGFGTATAHRRKNERKVRLPSGRPSDRSPLVDFRLFASRRSDLKDKWTRRAMSPSVVSVTSRRSGSATEASSFDEDPSASGQRSSLSLRFGVDALPPKASTPIDESVQVSNHATWSDAKMSWVEDPSPPHVCGKTRQERRCRANSLLGGVDHPERHSSRIGRRLLARTRCRRRLGRHTPHHLWHEDLIDGIAPPG